MTARGTQMRMMGLLRLARLLALAILTVVCAGIASPEQSVARLHAAVDVAAPDSGNAGWLLTKPSRQWRQGAPAVVRDAAVEAEIDDDDQDDDRDARSDVDDDSAAAFRGIWLLHTPGRALRDGPRTDSCSAFEKNFPRGPPTSACPSNA